jgi:hypothetical protein
MDTGKTYKGERVYITPKGTMYTLFVWKKETKRRYLIEIKCDCGKTTLVLRNNRVKKQFCSPECQYKAQSGGGNANWTGPKKRKISGHILAYAPDHPNARKNYVAEHRLVMEAILGRYLNENDVVHHINGVTDDNRIENLCLCNKSEHTKAHNSVIPLLKSLLDDGIIRFNSDSKIYERTK